MALNLKELRLEYNFKLVLIEWGLDAYTVPWHSDI